MNNEIKDYLSELPIKQKDLTCCEMIIKNTQESDILRKIKNNFFSKKSEDEYTLNIMEDIKNNFFLHEPKKNYFDIINDLIKMDIYDVLSDNDYPFKENFVSHFCFDLNGYSLIEDKIRIYLNYINPSKPFKKTVCLVEFILNNNENETLQISINNKVMPYNKKNLTSVLHEYSKIIVGRNRKSSLIWGYLTNLIRFESGLNDIVFQIYFSQSKVKISHYYKLWGLTNQHSFKIIKENFSVNFYNHNNKCLFSRDLRKVTINNIEKTIINPIKDFFNYIDNLNANYQLSYPLLFSKHIYENENIILEKENINISCLPLDYYNTFLKRHLFCTCPGLKVEFSNIKKTLILKLDIPFNHTDFYELMEEQKRMHLLKEERKVLNSDTYCNEKAAISCRL